MITLKFARAPGADVTQFRLYRAIVGFVANLNLAATGKTLILKIDGGAAQTITLGVSFVSDINAVLVGGKAYASLNNPLQFLVRSNMRLAPGSVEIVGGTALGDLGISPLLREQESNVLLLVQIPLPVNPDDVVTHNDLDGVLEDFYALSTVDTALVESNLTTLTRAQTPSGPLCEIEGTVIDLMGNPVVDAEVVATLTGIPHNTNARAYINNQSLCTRTDMNGNFSITVLQCAIVRLQIPAIFYDQQIRIPALSFVTLSELMIDTNYHYPLEPLG
jgi:hypothetical protein